jgi:hypothetical protein
MRTIEGYRRAKARHVYDFARTGGPPTAGREPGPHPPPAIGAPRGRRTPGNRAKPYNRGARIVDIPQAPAMRTIEGYRRAKARHLYDFARTGAQKGPGGTHPSAPPGPIGRAGGPLVASISGSARAPSALAAGPVLLARLPQDQAVGPEPERVDADESAGIFLIVATGDIHRREFLIVE